uniref:LRRNT domain-containing protein n=1 Tax=Octopus bimaculoides TaxID=37653 RepID=A0A0L8FVQ6_OCTBM
MFSEILLPELSFVSILYVILFFEAHAFSEFCNPCRCVEPQEISCKNLNLPSVPKDIPTNVEIL